MPSTPPCAKLPRGGRGAASRRNDWLALRGAIAAVRAWTSVYTWVLPLEYREARRAEIYWDLLGERPRRGVRLPHARAPDHCAAGRRHPLRSRLAQRARPSLGGLAMAGGAILIVLAVAMFGLWLVGERSTSAQLPDLPESLRVSPHGVRMIDAPPPPPPPPPPCPPSGFPQPPGQVYQVTGVRPGSDQGQTGVRPGFDQGQTPYSERRMRWRKASA